MGTNYELASEPPCPTCGRSGPERHIGKSSGGWCFSLHVYPEEGISDLSDWEPLLRAGTITDEYGREINADEMLRIITQRSWTSRPERDDAAFYAENNAIPGPNGLARSRVDGSHCIGHGKGTWDLFIGSFS